VGFAQPSGPGWASWFSDVGGMPSQGARTPEPADQREQDAPPDFEQVWWLT
jgi:hypothetical protein